MASDADLESKVNEVVRLEIDHLTRSPYLPGYIISELHHHPERVRQLISAVTGMVPDDLRPKLVATLRAQLDERIHAGALRPIDARTFLVNLMSLCIFPFAARPMLMALLGMGDRDFERFIARRRDELASFFLGALRP
jgi:AcrR family transcriptional regulator